MEAKRRTLEAVPVGNITVVVVDVATNTKHTHTLDAVVPVGLLKEEVQSELSLTPAEQKWTYQDKELRDEDSLGMVIKHSGAEIRVEKKQE